ncbi:MAG: tetratricopeptide repeat protein [Bacteroidales bacterium]|nr:tetratricopeptide repeat protein [Bacteroidales bacterium]
MKRLFAIILLSLAFTAGGVWAQGVTQARGSAQLMRDAEDLFEKEKYAVAQHLFDQCVQRADVSADNAAEASYKAAVCSQQLQLGDAEYRISEFMRLYPQSPRSNMARMTLGNVYFDRGDYAKALHEYLEVEPSEVEFGHRSEYDYKTGCCYFFTGNKDASKKYFERVSKGKSYYTNAATYYYAEILFSNKQYESADKEFKKIEKDKSLKTVVRIYRYFINYHKDEMDQVIIKAPELLNDKSMNKQLREAVARMAGDAHFKRRDYRQALSYYRMANADAMADKGTDQIPSTSNYQMGYCYYMMEKYDSAALLLSTFKGADDATAQNALYTLGDTYIKLDRKSEARSAFKSAADMAYDTDIQEDAAFNYAKLSCELNPNAYNESIRSFENYLKSYPNTKRRLEIQQILTSLYCTTKNYKDALSLIDRNKKEMLKDAKMRQAYQRILVNRGVELFNQRDLQKAAVLFDSAVAINATPAITTDAMYLSAESQYRLANYPKAQKLLDRFFTATSRKNSPYYTQALYTAGYVYMRRKKYSLAQEKFAEFLKLADKNTDRKQLLDTYNRMGDCLYVAKNFDGAISYYDKVINAKGQDADYAMYQKALLYGAQGKNQEKLTFLNYIFERYPNSPLSSKAKFEIANTYLICDNNEMAERYYKDFISQYSQSSYVPQALLNLGLIYYNTGRNEQALDVFDRLLAQYPSSDEARDAMMSVKNIFIEQDRVEDYFTYVSKTTKHTVSNVEQDSTLYLAAENRYFSGYYENAIAGFSNYLQKFPAGLFALKAHYYLADALTRTNQQGKALSHYEWVAQRGNNTYTENCLYQAATILYDQRNYNKAVEYYVMLVPMSSSDATRLQARMGILHCWYQLKDSAHVVGAADALLEDTKATDEQKDEANVLKARTYYYGGNYPFAFTAYAPLMSSANGSYLGEAAYRRAYICFSQGRLDDAESIIENQVNNPGSDYWLAKCFILWADVFHQRGNDLQAKQTLQSIIDNYEVVTDADEEIVSEARQHLQLLTTPPAQDDAPNDNTDGIIINLDGEE